MDYPSFMLLFFLCTNTFIPGGARFFLKSNGSSILVCDNIVGFFQQGLNIFKVVVACGMSQHQRCIGNLVYTLASPAIK